MADWMAFNVADYLLNTMHLTTRQHGGYILLICAAWNGKGKLPGTDAGLMAVAKLSPKEWQEDGDTLKAFLTRRGDAWVHERVEFEWNDANRLINAKSLGGSKGAKKRWEGRTKGQAMALPSESHRQDDAPLPKPVPEPVVEAASSVLRETAAPATEAAAAPTEARRIEDQAFDLWRETAKEEGFPDAGFLSSAQRPFLADRLREVGGLDGWRLALEKIRDARYLRNDDGTPKWWVNFKWLVDPGNFTGLMEGRYVEQHRRDNRSNTTGALEALAEFGRTGTG